MVIGGMRNAKLQASKDDEQSPCMVEEANFLKVPSKEVIENCIVNFIDKTSNVAVARAVCAVDGLKTETTVMDLANFAHKETLCPSSFHKSHCLMDGMLLKERGIIMSGSSKSIMVCKGCETEVKQGKQLKLVLANGMWIGNVPMELVVLTLPERILVAKCFPVAYIVKLFLKQKGVKTWMVAGCNSGLRGNVSTYHLNVEDIANLVDPIIMPPPPIILTTTIGMTIIEPQNIPEQTMPGFLHVKHSWIKDALTWLRRNNPLYGNIMISDKCLNLYAEEDCKPEEIKVITKYSDDMEAVDCEWAGYVVEDDDEDGNLGGNEENGIAAGISGKV